MRILFFIFFLSFFKLSIADSEIIGESTGYKLPRFVSVKSNESNLRVGAGIDYPIKLTYTIKNFPIEIIDEYEIWRKIRDINDNQGWMHKSLIKGNRYGIINTSHSESAQILNMPKGIIVGKIGNRNIVKINKCFQSWCYINIQNNKGWINKINLWGVYAKEEFNMPFYQFIVNFYWKIIQKMNVFMNSKKN